jgi:hypothetical protein
MSTIPGPIIAFRFDDSGLQAAVSSAVSRINGQISAANKTSAAQISEQIAAPIAQQAAKLRALYSTGALGLQALQVQQKALIATIDTEIAKLVSRNDLNTKELSTLKQITLERERQQNAVNRGVGVGVTAGTTSALQQGASGIIANISKLGTGLLGLTGASGAESTVFAGAASGIAAISAEAGIAVGVVGGLALALGAAGLAAVALGKAGTDVVLDLSNVSHQTGISIQNLQVLQAEGASVGLGLNDIVISFKKFSAAVSGETGGDAAGFEGAGNKAVAVLKALGVTSKDPITALEQTYNALSKLPDGFDRNAAASDLFGRSALNLIPIIDQGAAGFDHFRQIVLQYGPAITQNAVDTTLKARDAQVKLNLEIQNLEVRLIPVIGKLLDYGVAIGKAFSTPASPSKFSSAAAFLGPDKSLAQLPGQAVSATAALDKLAIGFSVGEGAASRMAKAVHGVVSGADDAARKTAEEIAKLNAESLGGALKQLEEINKSSQGSGLTGSDKTLEEERTKLEEIANIMLNFPSLAAQASGAANRVVQGTIAALESQANEALKKVQEITDKENADEAKRQTDLNSLIRGIDEDLAVDRAKIAQNAVATIIAEEQKRLDDATTKAQALGASEQQLQALRVAYNQDANAKIQALQTEQLKKTQDQIKSEAGKLFDTLISDPKNIGSKIKDQILQIVTQPVKSVFENIFSTLLTPFVSQGKNLLTSAGNSLKGKGGILGSIGSGLSGAGGNNSAITLNTTSTDANTTALTALTGILTGAAPGAVAAGSVSGISGAGSQLFNGIGPDGPGVFTDNAGTSSAPTGASAGAANAATLASIAPFANIAIGALGLIGGLVGGHLSASQAITSIATLGGGAVSTIGKSLNNGALQGAGTLIGGGGLVIGGIASSVHNGGIGGALQAGIGGAEIGALFGGPVGAVLGGAAGFVAGLFGDLFHHGVSQAAINTAVKRQSLSQAQQDALQGQTFNNALGSNFSQTSSTGFSEQPGGVFSTFGTTNTQNPAGITLHYNPVVQAFDATGVNAVLANHGTQIAKAIGAHITATNTGLGRSIRTAVSPA